MLSLKLTGKAQDTNSSVVSRRYFHFYFTAIFKNTSRTLNYRGQDSQDVIAERLRASCAEISHFNEFDFIVVNYYF